MSGCHEEISNVRDCQGDASFTYPDQQFCMGRTQCQGSVAGPKSYTGVFWKCYGPVTSFRARFSMTITTPGILVMNTMLIM